MTIQHAYRFTLTGKSGPYGLLMHQDNVEAADELSVYRKAMSRDEKAAGDDRSPAHTWTTYLYHNDNHVIMPAENIMAMLMQAASEITIKGNKSFKERSQSSISILDDFDLLVGGQPISWPSIEALKDLSFTEQANGARALGFALLVKRAGVNGKKHVRVRPHFKNWSVAGQLICYDAEMEAKLGEVFRIGGERKGLCDWRPGSPKRPGQFGTFTAALKRV